MKRIFLYGPPASGKTTLGKRLASVLKATCVDLDDAVEETAGRLISRIFKTEGEDFFRRLESQVLKDVVEKGEATVVSLGGGTLLRDENRALCEAHGTVLCLDPPRADILQQRLADGYGSRPLGDQSEKRKAHYATFEHRVSESFLAGPSLVVVGSSIAESVLSDMPRVVDENVAKIYGMTDAIYRIPSGEQNKTPETVMALWHAFAAKGLGRRDCVAAVGGGVTGDLTGFAAATWMRGMDWINVPTTLLAMVDASTGGKTGCDLPEGKNLAGAFHAPRLVVIDTDFLKTLPPQLMACGKAEMIKHEIIAGRFLPKIADNLRVKVNIVEKDPLETKGLRLLLNCGHTIAHAIEKQTNYAISHGEAVAIGCVEEARMAVQFGLAEKDWPAKVAILFKKAGLPTEMPAGLDFETLRPIMRGDKKRAGDVVTFALPCNFGKVRAIPVKV